MRELAVQSANGTNNDEDRLAIQAEVDQLNEEITRIGNTTEFNTKKLLNGNIDRKSYSSSNDVELISLSDTVGIGVYTIDITSLPRKAQVTTMSTTNVPLGAAIATDTVVDGKVTAAGAGNFFVNGEEITIEEGDDADTVFEKIRNLCDKVNVTLTAQNGGTPSLFDWGRSLVFTNDEYGSSKHVEIHADGGVMTLLGLEYSINSTDPDKIESAWDISAAGANITGLDVKVDLVLNRNDSNSLFKETSTVSSDGTIVRISDKNGFEIKFDIGEEFPLVDIATGINAAKTTADTAATNFATSGLFTLNEYSNMMSEVGNAMTSIQNDIQNTINPNFGLSINLASINGVDATTSDSFTNITSLLALKTGIKALVGTGTIPGVGASNINSMIQNIDKVIDTISAYDNARYTRFSTDYTSDYTSIYFTNMSNYFPAIDNVTINANAIAAATTAVTPTLITNTVTLATTSYRATMISAAYDAKTRVLADINSINATSFSGMLDISNFNGIDLNTMDYTNITSLTNLKNEIRNYLTTGTPAVAESDIKPMIDNIDAAIAASARYDNAYANAYTNAYISSYVDVYTNTYNAEIKVNNVSVALLSSGPMVLQIGANQYQTMDVRIPELTPKTLGVDKVNLTTSDGSQEALTMIDTAINTVSSIRSKLGAYYNRLEHSINNLEVGAENLTEALSRIGDADMAKEMATYTQRNVLAQAGTSMLAQANQRPQTILQLLQ